MATTKDDWLECDIPRELPLFPLLSTVVFPSSVVTIQVGRSRNLQLMDDYPARDQIIGLVVQKDSSIKEPSPDDLYTIGVAGRIIDRVKLSGHAMQIVLQGLRRFLIGECIQVEPYLRARVECVEQYEVNEAQANLHIGRAMNFLKKLIAVDPRMPEEVLNIIEMNLDGLDKLADQIATYSNFGIGKKQRIVEAIDPIERIKLVNEFLEEEIEKNEVKSDIRERAHEEMEKAQREYYLRQQLREIKKELGEDEESLSDLEGIWSDLREKRLPDEVRDVVKQELGRLEMIPPASSEYYKIRVYLEILLALPWYEKTRDRIDLKRARVILDEDHYGLEDVKDRILEFLAVQKLKRRSGSPILCFIGPPGVGKTSLGQSIARALGRRFARFSIGGMRDEAEIRGHRRTYVGSMPGKIIKTIEKCGKRNPLIMIDEIDKVGQDFRGDPASALLEVLDPEQNRDFIDHYLDLSFDLSDVLFITTGNILDNIPLPLTDRMEVLKFSGYTTEEKFEIARRHLLSEQIEKNGLKEDNLEVTDDGLLQIVEGYTREAGVRELERKIADICRKVARKIVEGEAEKEVVTSENLHELLGGARYHQEMVERTDRAGVATGLAWTPVGGKIIFVEATKMRGKGDFLLTGQLGDIMQESARAALSYIKSMADLLEIDEMFFETHDIHIHVPKGAIPKDGPSAGLTMTLALASLVSDKPLKGDVAMTGEITLRGRILSVGGIKEKVIAAHRAGISTLILPEDNRTDLEKVQQQILDASNFIFAENINQVFEAALMPIYLPERKLITEIEDERTEESVAPGDAGYSTK